MKLLRRCTFVSLLLLLVWSSNEASAQGVTLRSSGRLYWVSFIEGDGAYGAAEMPDLRLFISASAPTNIYLRDYRSSRVDTIRIDIPYVSTEVNVTNRFGPDIELNGRDRGTSKKVLQVSSDEEINLVGASIRTWSADAFYGLPDQILANDYVVLAYPNGLSGSLTDTINPGRFDQPSEFAVIATEDGTDLHVTPTALINRRTTLDPFTITLNRGEVFFAQAELRGAQDVTGTRISASKPVAVFGGNRRTSVPTKVGNYRDLLVEQLPPTEMWGRSAIIPPLYGIRINASFDPVMRIVAANDNTTVIINDFGQPPLKGGIPIEIPLKDDPTRIVADGPIMVTLYEHSENDDFSGEPNYGDPFMMLIPAEENFDTSYSFQSIPYDSLNLHVVTLVVPTADTASVRIDGTPITASFEVISNSNYSYAIEEVTPGAHQAWADSPFGLYVYGYGYAVSYGYPGGMVFRKVVVDYQKPVLSHLPSCGSFSGVATDNGLNDLGIDSCYVVNNSASNVIVNISPFTSGADSVFYTVSLQNPFHDGDARIKAIDKAGRSAALGNLIPGYTLGDRAATSDAPLRRETVAYNGESVCQEVELYNYGAFPHSIDQLDITPDLPGMSVTVIGSRTLAPGESCRVQLCYNHTGDTLIDFTLNIGDSCISREAAVWGVRSIVDTIAPKAVTRGTDCNQIVIDINEPNQKYYGVRSVDIITFENCLLSFSPSRDLLPFANVAMNVSRIDPYNDLIYEIETTDMAGNVSRWSDTIGGFTLAAYGKTSRDQLTSRFGAEWNGDSLDYLGRRCDSLLLVNYGSRTMRVDRGMFALNDDYSIPPSQFPLTILPGDTVMLQFCSEGFYAGERVDTLLLADACGRFDRIPFKTSVDFGYGYGADRCGQSITIQAFAPAKRNFLTTPFPNPSHGEMITADIGLKSDQNVSIELIDLSGHVVLTILKEEALTAGLQRLTFLPTGLPSGTYICRMTTGTGDSESHQLIIGK